MARTIWRVEWDIDGGKGPRTSLEFGQEDKAMKWADGIVAAGGKGVVATELIVGRIIHFDNQDNLFQK